MRVLFLGGGRRVELAFKFIERGHTVFAYTLDHRCPLAHLVGCDNIVSGVPWDNPAVADHVARVSAQFKIDAVVPLECAAAPVAYPAHGGCAAAAVCHDKAAFADFCEREFSFYYPTARAGDPAVVKPRFGNGSHGVLAVDHYVACPDGCVAQCRLRGPEVSVDAYFNRDAEFVYGVALSRDRVAGGEVVDATLLQGSPTVDMVRRVGQRLGLRGPVCAQFMYGPRGYQLVEINHRFGGGATFSIAAGFDMVDLLRREAEGETVAAETYRPHVRWGLKLKRAMSDYYFE